MRPFAELTRLGQLRRLRGLAEVALAAYGLSEARLTFLHYQGNVIFRVDVQEGFPATSRAGVYLPNRYLLRVLSISDFDTIQSELTWLRALSQEAGLPVPEPVPTLTGELFTRIVTPGVPNGRVVTLMRWVEGRRISQGLNQKHIRAWGHLMGELHAFAAAWQPPPGFKRFQWDWAGLMSESGVGYPIDELVASMPERFREPYYQISRRVREAMESFGKGPEAYGLIHADMLLENLVFKAGEPRAIDFEDCGFGYWMFDIGIAMSEWWMTEDKDRFRDAYMEGYSLAHGLPGAQSTQLDLFVAAHYASLVLWSAAFIKFDQARRVEHEAWLEREGNNLLRCYRAF